MTTISPNRARRGARIRILYLAIAVILFLALALLARGMLSGSLWQIMRPLSYARAAGGASLGNFFSNFSSNAALVEENARLRALLASSSILAMDRSLLYAQNLDLESRLGRPDTEPAPLLASVLLAPPATPYDTLMLDVGRKSGVSVGDLVAAGGEVYIGEVSEVYADTSRVTLYSAPGSQYSARLLTSAATSSIPLSVSGQGGGSLQAELPAGTPAAIGDEVLIPGLNPKLIANVVAIEGKNEGSFKTLYMHLPVNVYGLRFVEVHRQIIPLHAQ